MSKLKTIEIQSDTTIAGVKHRAGDVVKVVEHWADWLVKQEAAKETNKKPTRPSPTPVDEGKAEPAAAKPAADNGGGEAKPAGN